VVWTVGDWRNELKDSVMPLTRLQSQVLRLLAAQRTPESFVAGSTPLNWNRSRYSGDIDIFNDEQERLHEIVAKDFEVLKVAGLAVALAGPRSLYIQRGTVTSGDETCDIDWVVDSDFRFFPAVPDEQFGYVLHPIDLAVNKASAASSRRVPRDIVDLITIDSEILSLGAVLCAAVGRFPGSPPEEMLNDISRQSNFSPPEYGDLKLERPLNIAETHRKIRQMIERARDYVSKMPSDGLGAVYLKDGAPVEPDPTRLGDYVRHDGARRGHWPTSSLIGSAMLERYIDPKPTL
jgi:hypothetical protein